MNIIKLYSFMKNCNIDLILYKSKIEYYGGFYGVRMIDHDKLEIKDKKGLTLDAACDVFYQTREEILSRTQ